MLSSGTGISSVAHQLSCFGVGFSLCLITGGLFLCLAPFSGARSVIYQPAGDELCGLLPALFQAVAYHLPAVSPSAFPAFFLLKVNVEDQLLASPPFSGVLLATPSCCVLVFSSLFIV
jgi:hypothetical protein